MAVTLSRDFMESVIPQLIEFIEAQEMRSGYIYYLIAGPYYVRYEIDHGFLHELIVFESFLEYESDRVRNLSKAIQQTGLHFN